jgi:hypothetical protein
MTYRSSRIRNGSPGVREQRRLIVKKSRTRSDGNNLRNTRAELIERLAIAPQKIAVIPPGIAHPAPGTRHPAPHPAPHPTPGTSTQHSAPSTQHPGRSHPTVLFTGSVFNRRHVPDLIRAFAPIVWAYPDAFLDITATIAAFFSVISPEPMHERLDGRVRFHRYVTEEQPGVFTRTQRPSRSSLNMGPGLLLGPAAGAAGAARHAGGP